MGMRGSELSDLQKILRNTNWTSSQVCCIRNLLFIEEFSASVWDLTNPASGGIRGATDVAVISVHKAVNDWENRLVGHKLLLNWLDDRSPLSADKWT